MAEPIDVLFGL